MFALPLVAGCNGDGDNDDIGTGSDPGLDIGRRNAPTPGIG